MSLELYSQCIETIDSFSQVHFLEETDTWSLKAKLLELKNPPQEDQLKTFYSNFIEKINQLELKSMAQTSTKKIPSQNSNQSITESLKLLKENSASLSQNIKKELFSTLINELSQLIDYYKNHGQLKKIPKNLEEEDLPSTQELNLNDNNDAEDTEEEYPNEKGGLPYIITNEDNNNRPTEDEKDDKSLSRTSSM